MFSAQTRTRPPSDAKHLTPTATHLKLKGVFCTGLDLLVQEVELGLHFVPIVDLPRVRDLAYYSLHAVPGLVLGRSHDALALIARVGVAHGRPSVGLDLLFLFALGARTGVGVGGAAGVVPGPKSTHDLSPRPALLPDCGLLSGRREKR